MQRKTRWLLLIGGAGAATAIAAILLAPLFLPERATRVNEAMPDESPDAVLRQGTFSGNSQSEGLPR